MRQKGTVKWFDNTKGYGFIIPEGANSDIFVHQSNIDTVGNIIDQGELVEFEVAEGNKGPQAIKVTKVIE